MLIIIKQDHMPDCRANANASLGIWDSPWVMFGKPVSLDKRGGHTGTTYRFTELKCNDTLCDAYALAECSIIEQAVYTEQRALEFRDKAVAEAERAKQNDSLLGGL